MLRIRRTPAVAANQNLVSSLKTAHKLGHKLADQRRQLCHRPVQHLGMTAQLVPETGGNRTGYPGQPRIMFGNTQTPSAKDAVFSRN